MSRVPIVIPCNRLHDIAQKSRTVVQPLAPAYFGHQDTSTMWYWLSSIANKEGTVGIWCKAASQNLIKMAATATLYTISFSLSSFNPWVSPP
jgi:hypothetical protein